MRIEREAESEGGVKGGRERDIGGGRTNMNLKGERTKTDGTRCSSDGDQAAAVAGTAELNLPEQTVLKGSAGPGAVVKVLLLMC